jgi:hypothetical protein
MTRHGKVIILKSVKVDLVSNSIKGKPLFNIVIVSWVI